MLRFLVGPLLLASLSAGIVRSQVQLTNAFPALTFTRPVFLTHATDGSDRVFVVQQDGLIKVFPNDSSVTSAKVFLNITSKLSSTTGEEGLLGLAFHPDYENNGYFYIDYTAPASPIKTVIARYSVSQTDPDRADSLSEEVILEINQPYTNHNGGMVLFGTDGYLHIGMGDGGSGGDPGNNAQNTQSLLGKILRIDIDTTAGYRIPPTNPFAGNPAAGREEIFAWGYRNPWRFSQDTTSAIIYVGDVGQNAWEEVDLLYGGLNYGWRCYEGNVAYNTTGCGPITDYIFPIKVYPHSGGDCSITGGYVYRGYRRPELTGAYIYGDYCTGKIRLLRYEGGQVIQDSLLIDAPFSVSSFGVDREGELYVCNYSGNIQRFVGPPLNSPPGAFDLLSPPEDTTFVFNGLRPEVQLSWAPSVDPNGDTVRYTIEIDTSATFMSGAFRDTLVGEPTSATVAFDRETRRYYWRVRASDGELSVLSNSFRSLNITYVNNPPAAFGLIAPPEDTTFVFSGKSPSVTFSWDESVDPDSDAVTYILQIDTTATFDSPALRDSLAGGLTTFQVEFPSVSDAYYWRVESTDGRDTVLSDESRRVNISIALSVQPDQVPEESALEQNYPNPFNPVTTIKYSIPTGGHVRLTVFNLLGQLVKVLYEGAQNPGQYEIEFRSSEVPSGIYFYRIEAPGFVETKKMVIAK